MCILSVLLNDLPYAIAPCASIYTHYPEAAETGTASTAIAVPKLKQVRLSCTKMRVDIAAKLYTVSERYVLTINDYYYNYLAPGVHRRSVELSWPHTPRAR